MPLLRLGANRQQHNKQQSTTSPARVARSPPRPPQQQAARDDAAHVENSEHSGSHDANPLVAPAAPSAAASPASERPLAAASPLARHASNRSIGSHDPEPAAAAAAAEHEQAPFEPHEYTMLEDVPWGERPDVTPPFATVGTVFTQRFESDLVEDEYRRFLFGTASKANAVVVCALAAFMTPTTSSFFIPSRTPVVEVLWFVTVGTFVLGAILSIATHLHFRRRFDRAAAAHTAAEMQRHQGDVATVVRYNVNFTFVLVTALIILMDIRWCIVTPHPEDTPADRCECGLPDMVAMFIFFTFFMLRLPADATVSAVVLFAVEVLNSVLGMTIASLNPRSIVARFVTLGVMLVCALGLSLLRSTTSREHFESIIGARTAAARQVQSTRHVHELARSLLPKRLAQRLGSDGGLDGARELLADCGRRACVVATGIHSFDALEASTPFGTHVVRVVSRLFALFDVGCDVFKLDRGSTHGDLYTVSIGLLQEPRRSDVKRLAQYMVWQHGLKGTEALPLVSGMAGGVAWGRVMGARSMRYVVGGPAAIGAIGATRHAQGGEALVGVKVVRQLQSELPSLAAVAKTFPVRLAGFAVLRTEQVPRSAKQMNLSVSLDDRPLENPTTIAHRELPAASSNRGKPPLGNNSRPPRSPSTISDAAMMSDTASQTSSRRDTGEFVALAVDDRHQSTSHDDHDHHDENRLAAESESDVRVGHAEDDDNPQEEDDEAGGRTVDTASPQQEQFQQHEMPEQDGAEQDDGAADDDTLSPVPLEIGWFGFKQPDDEAEFRAAHATELHATRLRVVAGVAIMAGCAVFFAVHTMDRAIHKERPVSSGDSLLAVTFVAAGVLSALGAVLSASTCATSSLAVLLPLACVPASFGLTMMSWSAARNGPWFLLLLWLPGLLHVLGALPWAAGHVLLLCVVIPHNLVQLTLDNGPTKSFNLTACVLLINAAYGRGLRATYRARRLAELTLSTAQAAEDRLRGVAEGLMPLHVLQKARSAPAHTKIASPSGAATASANSNSVVDAAAQLGLGTRRGPVAVVPEAVEPRLGTLRDVLQEREKGSTHGGAEAFSQVAVAGVTLRWTGPAPRVKCGRRAAGLEREEDPAEAAYAVVEAAMDAADQRNDAAAADTAGSYEERSMRQRLQVLRAGSESLVVGCCLVRDPTEAELRESARHLLVFATELRGLLRARLPGVAASVVLTVEEGSGGVLGHGAVRYGVFGACVRRAASLADAAASEHLAGRAEAGCRLHATVEFARGMTRDYIGDTAGAASAVERACVEHGIGVRARATAAAWGVRGVRLSRVVELEAGEPRAIPAAPIVPCEPHFADHDHHASMDEPAPSSPATVPDSRQ